MYGFTLNISFSLIKYGFAIHVFYLFIYGNFIKYGRKIKSLIIYQCVLKLKYIYIYIYIKDKKKKELLRNTSFNRKD